MAFCFAPTEDQAVNERFCWLLLDWLTAQEREAADAAITAPLRGEPEDAGLKTPSHRRYEAVVVVARNVSAEMRGFSGLHNPIHGAESIAEMIDPAIDPRYREPVEGDSAANRFVARQRAKYGSGSAIVSMLIAQAKQQASS